MGLEAKAQKIYNLKKDLPDIPISKRCLDFELLEKYASTYNK